MLIQASNYPAAKRSMIFVSETKQTNNYGTHKSECQKPMDRPRINSKGKLPLHILPLLFHFNEQS